MADTDLETLFQAKRFAEAEAQLRRQLNAAPDDSAALYNLSLALARQGRLAEAMESLGGLLRQPQPQSHVLHTAMKLLLALRRPAAAASLAAVLAQRHPGTIEPQLHLALALRLDGKLNKAERAAREALRIAPQSGEAMAELAFTLLERGKRDEAVPLLRRSLKLDPGNELRQRALADLLMKAGRPDEALSGYKEIVARKNDSLDGWVGVLRTARLTLDWTAEAEALKRLRDALHDPARQFWLPTQLALYFGFTAEELLTIARRYAERLQREVPLPALPKQPRPDDGRLRVAYVSPDFRQHAIWDLTGEILAAHDRERFAVAGFALNRDDGSAACQEVKTAFEQVTFLPDANERETAQAIADWTPDILVDLGGYTRGSRPTAVRIAPASYKLLWVGMPGTTGAPWMQGYLGDGEALPPGLEPSFSEKVLRLPRCYYPSRALAAERRVTRAEAGLPEQALVFSAFHNDRKLDRESFQLWVRILRRTEGTVLWLQSVGPATQRALRQRAEQSGIAAERLIFAPGLPWRQHLARLALADLALDALVYGAHTSASDALRVGVPILTVAGRTMHSRVASSMLMHLGLPELVAPTADAMEETAVTLAEDRTRLAQLRSSLAALLPKASLFDPSGFARDLEKLYLGLAGRR